MRVRVRGLLTGLVPLLLVLAGFAALSGTAHAADTTPPAPVTSFVAQGGSGSITLSWTNPTTADLAGVLVVRKVGTVAPVSAADGVQVVRVLKPTRTYTDRLLDAATSYAYAAFAYDTSGNLAKPAKAVAKTALAPPAVVRLDGTLAADVTLTPKKAKLFLVDSTFAVPSGRVLTLGAGVKMKVRHDLDVAGTLRSTGTPTRRALVTSVYDDTVGGNAAGTVGAPSDNPFRIDLQQGGLVQLAGADLRYGRLVNSVLTASSPGSLTVRASVVRDSRVELNFSGGGASAATLTGNTFTRSSVYLADVAAPVMSGNTVADGAGFGSGVVPRSPVYLTGIGDLAGVGANTVTGTAVQRLFVIVNSAVRTSWTLLPGYVYGLSDVTVERSGTMTATDGTQVTSLGRLDVLDGGTLTAAGTTFGTWPDAAVGDIAVRPGGTAAIARSTLDVPLTANLGFSAGLLSADVSVTSSTAVAIDNLPKDWPGLSAVDGAGSIVEFAASHTHLCVPPPVSPPLPSIDRVLWDVEGTVGRVDSPECPPGYTEQEGHP